LTGCGRGEPRSVWRRVQRHAETVRVVCCARGYLGAIGHAAVKSARLRLGIVTVAPLGPKGQNITV